MVPPLRVVMGASTHRPAQLSCNHNPPILHRPWDGVAPGAGQSKTSRPAPRRRQGAWLNDEEMRQRLQALRTEHRDLDAAIDALSAAGGNDQLQIARLKKRKLRLKDQMAMLADHLIPDIIA